MDRQLHTWNVTLANEQTGASETRPFRAYWSPEKDFVPPMVGPAAAAEATWATNGKTRFIPVAVEFVDESVEARAA